MLQRIHIQILDNPIEEIILSDYTSEAGGTNKILTAELSKEMNYFFASVVFVEYVDLFMDNEEEFDDIRELLRMGAITTPIVIINGVIKIHGGIPTSIIRREVEKLLSTGPMH